MFFAIFINMNKSATLKLDKFIQEILDEQTDPNSPFYVKPKPSLADLGIYPNTMPVSPSDRLTKANYTTLGTIAKANAGAAELALYKTDPWAAKEKAVAAAAQRAAKAIAKTIYDAKGTFSDDMYLVVKAIKQIKDAKQFYLVQTELQKLTNGRGIGQYIVSFLGTTIGGVADLNLAETLRDGETIVKHLKSIKADPVTIKIINDRLAIAKVQKSVTPYLKVAAKALGTSGLPLDLFNTINDVNAWTYDHNTWDTMINGANGKDDGLRGASYSIGGIVVTTILALIPHTKAITGAIFGLLAVDDIYRISKGNYDMGVWMDLVLDLIGVMAGGASSIFKGAIRPIAALLAAVSKGVKGKALLPLIEAVQRMAGGFANTKFGQLLIKLGEGIGTFITSLVNKLSTQFISALKLVAKKNPKLMSWCNQIINIISNVVSGIGNELKNIWKALKFIWQILSAPGKSASWIIQKAMPYAPAEVKLAFGAGGKIGVNYFGIKYLILPEIRNFINPAIPNPMELAAVNTITMLNGSITCLTKIPPGEIACYERDENGKFSEVGVYEQIYIPIEGKNIPLVSVMHTETKTGNWIQIGITPTVNDFHIGNVNETLYWVDSRQLIVVNEKSLAQYITKTNQK